VLASLAEAAARLIDVSAHPGIHPHVGALDVAPVVWLTTDQRGAACAEALVTAQLLGELGLPVYLYGVLAGGRTRAELRRPGALRGLVPDFGPRQLHPTAGAVLVAARAPLIAFNVELQPPATLEDAKRIATAVRSELTSVRTLGLWMAARSVAQVSTNVEDHLAVPLRDVVAAVARHAPVAGCEVVGLPPAAAFDGFPDDVPVTGRRTVEDALARVSS
jgi:glutamate formiminotransferase